MDAHGGAEGAKARITPEALANFLLMGQSTSVKRLDLSNNPGILSGDAFTIWTHMEALEELKLASCRVTPEALANFLLIGQPTSVKRLDLSDNPGILSAEALTTWTHVEVLEELKLASCRVTPEALANFLLMGQPISVKRLDLSDNPGILSPTGGDLPMWADFEALEELKLASCRVTPEALANFLLMGQPISVKRLDLSDNPGILSARGSDFPMWEHLEVLEELNLAGCVSINDPVLETLADLGFTDPLNQGCWRRHVAKPVAQPPARSLSNCVSM